MNKLLEWDTEIFLWLNSLGTETWDPFWLQVSEVVTWIPLYGVLLFLVIRALKGRAILWALLVLVLNVFLTDQGSTWLFKEQFERLRPCHVEVLIDQIRLVKGGCGGQFGFLSAHASNTFGLAVLIGLILRRRYRWLLPVLLMWASFVAYSRIYLGVHYPLDLIAGALYGSLCGYLLYQLYLWLISKQKLQND